MPYRPSKRAVNCIFGRYIKYYAWHKCTFFFVCTANRRAPYEYYA